MYEEEYWELGIVREDVHPEELMGPTYLCHKCQNLEGENGPCKKYPNMTFQMFRRKNKCKYFKKFDWNVEIKEGVEI
jgi:hypothetical protein